MRKVAWRFWTLDQFKQEEQWLNEMANEGWALIDTFAARYVFESCEPGEYTYKIMFTNSMPRNEKRIDFENFLAENGIETVGKYLEWRYYRKKNDGTPFQLFNSTAEELNHALKIKNFASFLIAVLTVCLFVELMCVIINPYMFPRLIFIACVFLFIFKVYRGTVKIVKELENQVNLFE